MVGNPLLPDIPFDKLALEPIEGEATGPITGRARFSCNTREKYDRRQQEERRQKFRMQPQRRLDVDRRPPKRDWGDKEVR